MRNLNEMTAKELKAMAKELHISNWWTKNKAQLIEDIEAINFEEEIEEVEEVEEEKEEKKSRGKMIEWNGKSQNLGAWAKELGFTRQTLYARLYLQNWDVEKAFTTPGRNK